MENLDAVLEAAGAGWGDVVKTTVYLHDMAHFPTVNEIYGRWIGDARPARSTVQVAALPRGALVEIDLIAAHSFVKLTIRSRHERHIEDARRTVPAYRIRAMRRLSVKDGSG